MLVCAKGGLTPCLIIAKISALNVTICNVKWHHEHVQRPLCVPRGPLLSSQRDLPTTTTNNYPHFYPILTTLMLCVLISYKTILFPRTLTFSGTGVLVVVVMVSSRWWSWRRWIDTTTSGKETKTTKPVVNLQTFTFL